MAYRWFLGLSITDTVPNYSTFSQNYIRRFKNTNVFENIFSTVITKLFEMNLVDTSVIFVDGTHVKASANKHKIIKKQVKVIADKYQKAMEEEINEYRKEMGREFYDDDSDGSGFTVNEETGEIIESNTKTVTVSTTDRDCGMFIKGEHERQLAYVDMCCCDKNGWNLGFHVNPANMHDSKAFLPFLKKLL